MYVELGFLGSCDLLCALEKYFTEYCNRFARQLRTIAASFGFKKGQVYLSNGYFKLVAICDIKCKNLVLEF